MKTKLLIILSLVFVFACKKHKVPGGYIEYQGKEYKEPTPVEVDLNNDGVIDPTEKINVLGTSLDVTETPDGNPLYKGSSSNSGSLVPEGEKLCYLDLDRNCDKYGALYGYETSMNGSIEEQKLASQSQTIDENKNGIVDYIETLRTTQIDVFIADNITEAVAQAEALIEDATDEKISTFVLQTTMEDAVSSSLLNSFYKDNYAVDVYIVEQELAIAIAESIITFVEDANLDHLLTKEELENIAFTVAEDLAKKIAEDLAAFTSQAVLNDYIALSEVPGAIVHQQGICPNGYHIPSDVEWMIFEKALGMSPSDLTKSGITVTTRGADAGVVKTMLDDHGFDYGGYMSINGTYAQLAEAGVYWSSTVGTDDKGTYVWVRQIDTSYTGVVRYKHYEMSGLSIRCFKD